MNTFVLVLKSTKLQIFADLIKPRTIVELAGIMGVDHSTVSKSIRLLEKDGLIVKQRSGRYVYIVRSDFLHSKYLVSILAEYPRLPLSDIFTSSTLHILSVLEEQRSKGDLAIMTGLDKRTVSSALLELTKYGIVLKENGKYVFSKRHTLFKDFVDNYWKYISNKTLSTISEDAIVLWQRGPEIFFKINGEVKFEKKGRGKTGVFPASISIFNEYGLKVMTDTRYYFYTRRKLQKEDHFIHTILIDPYSTIYNSYALIFAFKVSLSVENLVKFGEYYDLKDHVRILLEYLQKKEKNSNFVLPWLEYEDLKRDLD